MKDNLAVHENDERLAGHVADETKTLILQEFFYSAYLSIYLEVRELERCACFNSTNTAAGVIPSIRFAAPCNTHKVQSQ